MAPRLRRSGRGARQDQLHSHEERAGRGRHREARDTADAGAPGRAVRGGEGQGMSEDNNVPSKAYAPVENVEMGREDGKTAKLKIFRGDAEGGEEVEYELPLVEGMAVLYSQAHQANELAVRWNCKAAHCGSCSAEINGRPRQMCKTRIEEYEGAE